MSTAQTRTRVRGADASDPAIHERRIARRHRAVRSVRLPTLRSRRQYALNIASFTVRGLRGAAPGRDLLPVAGTSCRVAKRYDCRMRSRSSVRHRTWTIASLASARRNPASCTRRQKSTSSAPPIGNDVVETLRPRRTPPGGSRSCSRPRTVRPWDVSRRGVRARARFANPDVLDELRVQALHLERAARRSGRSTRARRMAAIHPSPTTSSASQIRMRSARAACTPAFRAGFTPTSLAAAPGERTEPGEPSPRPVSTVASEDPLSTTTISACSAGSLRDEGLELRAERRRGVPRRDHDAQLPAADRTCSMDVCHPASARPAYGASTRRRRPVSGGREEAHLSSRDGAQGRRRVCGHDRHAPAPATDLLDPVARAPAPRRAAAPPRRFSRSRRSWVVSSRPRCWSCSRDRRSRSPRATTTSRCRSRSSARCTSRCPACSASASRSCSCAWRSTGSACSCRPARASTCRSGCGDH